jgi:hypothetical protein
MTLRDDIVQELKKTHFDGTGCGTKGTSACSNCYGEGSQMTAEEIADLIMPLIARDEPAQAEEPEYTEEQQKAQRLVRMWAIGKELRELDSVVDHLLIAYGNKSFAERGTGARYDAYDTQVWAELNERREELRQQLVEMG